MLDIFNTPSPQKSNYQEFYGGGTTFDWIKPRGASMVRMLLIGAGGGGCGSSSASGGPSGGSGAVTQWIGPAMFIPDILRINIGKGGVGSTGIVAPTAATATTVVYQAKDGTGYTLLTANQGAGSNSTGGAAGAASSNNYFGAAGIFQSIAGQAGVAENTAQSASTTTFLSGGAGGSLTAGGKTVTGNYGYTAIGGTNASVGNPGGSGYLIRQPILVGVGGAGGGYGTGTTGGSGGQGGVGCGGGGAGQCSTGTAKGGNGGDGAVFIWAW